MSVLRSCIFASAVIAQLTYAQGAPDTLQTDMYACEEARNISIESTTKSDVAHACLGIERATRFLSSHGFAIPTIKIKIVDVMPDNIPASALGAYSSSSNEILVLSFSVFLDRSKANEVFNIPVDEFVYSAVIAHEVAHAAAFHNFRVPPTSLAQEYIAFVTFYSSLDGDRCEDILRHYPYDEDWMQYSAILYLSDQAAFGAHAYRHFQRSENGQQFFRKILEGEVFGVDE